MSTAFCHPAISSSVTPSPSSLNLSQHQGLFQWVGCSHQMTRILELQLQHQSFQWVSGLISIMTDWFELLAVQGTFRNLIQHHSSKASILSCPAFSTFQLSQLYVTIRKTIGLTMWILVSRVMSLIFSTLSRFVLSSLPGSNCLLISWLPSRFTVILEPPKRKSVTASTFSPSICSEVVGLRPWSWFFKYLVLSQLVHSPPSPSKGPQFLFTFCH